MTNNKIFIENVFTQIKEEIALKKGEDTKNNISSFCKNQLYDFLKSIEEIEDNNNIIYNNILAVLYEFKMTDKKIEKTDYLYSLIKEMFKYIFEQYAIWFEKNFNKELLERANYTLHELIKLNIISEEEILSVYNNFKIDIKECENIILNNDIPAVIQNNKENNTTLKSSFMTPIIDNDIPVISQNNEENNTTLKSSIMTHNINANFILENHDTSTQEDDKDRDPCGNNSWLRRHSC